VNSGLTDFLNNWTRNYVDGAKVTPEEEEEEEEVESMGRVEFLELTFNFAKQQDYTECPNRPHVSAKPVSPATVLPYVLLQQ